MKTMEKEVTIQGKVTLRGTLSIPERQGEKMPAILIIPGSGKLDRNGRVNKKLNLKLYRQLAEFLTTIGFVNLRFDKRGVGASEGEYLKTGLWDLVDDAKAALQFLKSLPEVDSENVIVMGHSEGSMIGTAVAAREELAGLILLSGAGEKLSDALQRQRDLARQDILKAKGFQGFLLRLLGTHNKLEKQAQKYIKKVQSSTEDVIKVSFIKTNAKWIREHFVYNVLEDLAKVMCPVLAITGALDVQANPEVLKDLPQYVKGDVEYHIIENMGHACKYITTTSNMLTIKKDIKAEGELPLHSELERVLEKWLLNRFIQTRTGHSVII